MPHFSPSVLEILKEATDQGFWLIDADGVSLDVNPAMCRLLGRPREQIIGGTIYDFVDEENAEVFRAEIAARRKGKKGKYELSLQQPDGANRPCINNAVVIHDEAGKRIGSVGIWTDISELKQAQQQLAEAQRNLERRVSQQSLDLERTEEALFKSQDAMRDFAECSTDWFWETDDEMRFTFLSERIRDATGYGPEHFLGRTRREIAGGTINSDEFDAHLRVLENKAPFRNFEYKFESSDGELLTVATSGVPVLAADGRFLGYRGSVSNITERVKVETARDEALLAAEAANNAKTAFLASMSHEIRTPMSGVIGMADMLLDDTLSDSQRQRVQTIKDAGQSLITILNDILDLSKVQANKLEIEKIDFDLRRLISDTLSLLQSAASGKSINLGSSIAPNLPSGVKGDPTRIRQILVNLLGNALKFTESGSVNLKVTPTQEDGGHMILRFEVEDTGIGIAVDRQHALFQEFTQLDSSTARKYEGTGLGLAISKRLTELMGGEIGVESTEGAGSTFWFTTPVQVTELEERRSGERSEQGEFHASRPLRLLLAEDNKINQTIISAIMSKFGHMLTIVDDGQAAIEALRENDFDLILMDVRMPGMDGIDATRMIRQQGDKNSEIPIIAVTADAIAENFERYVEAGMNTCVSKPIDQSELLFAVNRTLEEEVHLFVSHAEQSKR